MNFPPLRPGLIPPFHELGEDAFEDLSRELLQEEPDVETVERYGTRKGQRQLGIDLLIEFKDKSLGVGQCKSHQRCDETLIRKACEEFLEHAEHWRCQGVKTFILLVAADTRRTQLHDERLRQRALLRQRGFSFTVWSGAVFKAKLRRRRAIVRHFLPYLEDYICGPSGQVDVQLSVQHETIQALVKQLGGVAEGDHAEVRRLWQEGHPEQALARLRTKKAEGVTWAVLPPNTKAKFLRLEARLVLTSGDVEAAKSLAAEAHGLDGSNGGRLSAMIAQAEGRLDEAIAVLESDQDSDSQALKAAVQIQAGLVDDAIHTLEQLPEHPDAHRLRSLIHLGKGEPIQAKAEAEKALALAPSWYWMRRTAATMQYLAGLSPAAVPRRVPDWPEPVNSTLIRQDEESVSARRAAALEFERLASGDFELSGEELSCLNCWRIACLADNTDTRQEATNLARSILQTNPGDYRVVFWVLGRDLDVTIDASVAVIAHRVSEKNAGVEETVCLVVAHAKAGRLSSAKAILLDAKELFARNSAEQLWHLWDRQLDALDQASNDASASVEDRAARVLARLREAEAEGDRDTSWQQYLLLAQLGRWDEIAPVAKALVSLHQTADAVRLASYALYNTGDFAGCLEVLDQAPAFHHKGELPGGLRRLRVLAQQASGALPSAIKTAREALEQNRTAESLLELARLYFQVGDFKAIAVEARHHETLPDLTALQCLQLAFYLKFEDSNLALALWKRAVASGIDDEHVTMAFGIATNLGVGVDTKPLVDRIAALGAERRGGVRGFRLEELSEWMATRRKQLDDVYAKLTAGEIPNHTALGILGVSLARAFHRFPLITSGQTDGRSAAPVFQRFGGRVSGALWGAPKTSWRLNADVTALLSAAHFGLLSKLESEFGTIRIPQNTIHALNRMRDDLRASQPDRVAAVQRVLGALSDGRIDRVRLEPIGARRATDGDVADDVLQFLRHADLNDAFVVDFLPVRSVNPMRDAEDVSPHYAKLLRDAHSVVDALAQCGSLSKQERDKAIEGLGTRGGAPCKAAVPAGKRLICRFDVAELLALAGVLDVMTTTFRVSISSDEADREQVQAENTAIGNMDADWVATLAEHLRNGVNSGAYELLPQMPARIGRSEDSHEPTPEETVLLDLLQFPPTDSDVVWSDDRYVTAFERRDGMAVVGTVDLLLHLKEMGRLSVSECAHTLIDMRAADVRFVAFDEDELSAAVLEAPVENGCLVETKSLRVLRQYYARCLLQAEMLKPPSTSDGTPNPTTEWNFLLGCGRAVVMAMLKVFEKSDGDASLRAEWLIRNMYSDDRGVHGTAAVRTLANDEYRAAVSLVSLIANSMHLDGDKPRRRARRDYLKWLHHAVIRPRFAAERELASATIDQLKRVMAGAIERDDPTKEAVLTRLVGRLWQDLPMEIRNVLDTDQDFLRSIGVSVTSIAAVGPIRVDRRVLWEALAQTLADGERRLIEATNKAAVELERVSESPIEFRIKCSDLGFEGHLAGDEFGFLSDSFADRERSAARLTHWFDIPQDRRNELVAKVIGGQDPSTRMDLAAEARKASVEELYRRVFDSIKPGGTFRPSDFPVDPQHLLDHLRLELADAPDTRWSQAASRLVADLGVVGAVMRLGGIPVRLSDEIVRALRDLEPARRCRSMRVIRKALLASPVGVVQLADLWARLSVGSPHRLKIQALLAGALCTELHRPTFDAWLTTLRWTEEQFGFDQRMRALPRDLHLTLVWAHADRLFRVLMATGVAPEWIQAIFDRKDYGVAPSLVFHDADFSNDVASPERVHAETLVMAGLGLVAASDSELTETFRNAVERGIESSGEDGQQKLFYPLLADTDGATNRIGSWLGNGSRHLMLLPPAIRPLFTQEAISAMVCAACAAIAAKENEQLNWMKLFAVHGDFPPATKALDAMQSTLLAVDLAGYLNSDPWCVVAALRIVGQHAKQWGEPIRANIETQLFELAKKIGEMTLEPDVRRALKASILDSLVSCTWWHAEGEARTIALASVLERLANGGSPVFERAGLLVLRLCDALPVREARHLWRTRDLLRRATRL